MRHDSFRLCARDDCQQQGYRRVPEREPRALLRYSCNVHAAILSASSFASLWRCRAARLLALLQAWRQGPLGRSALLPHLALGGLGLPLSRECPPFDRSAPNAYIPAPHNELHWTNQLWLDLLGGLEEIASRQALARIDAELPLLVIGSGHRLHGLFHALRAAGLNSVELKLYPEARHALLHEHGRDAVIDDLLDWLAHLPARQPYCPLEENA